jgi:hypothetical protein
MNASAAFGWLKNAVNLGRQNPKAVFGGVALMIAATLAVAVVMSVLQGVLVTALGADVMVLLGSSLLMGLAIVVVLAGLMAGFLRLIDAVENGRPAGAFDVFGGFGAGVGLRTIGLLLLTALAQYALMGLLLSVLAADAIAWYMEVMQASAAGAPPPVAGLPGGFGLAMAVMVVIGLLAYAVQAIGVCQIALRGRGVFGALADGVAGTFKNLLPLLVLTLTLILACVVVGVAVLLVAMVLGLLAELVGVWLAVVIAIPLYLLAMLALYTVMFGLMYYLWRDICGESAGAAPAGDALTV